MDTEFSNTIWAFATAGVRGVAQVELIRFLADALDEGNGLFFGFEFKRKCWSYHVVRPLCAFEYTLMNLHAIFI